VSGLFPDTAFEVTERGQSHSVLVVDPEYPDESLSDFLAEERITEPEAVAILKEYKARRECGVSKHMSPDEKKGWLNCFIWLFYHQRGENVDLSLKAIKTNLGIEEESGETIANRFGITRQAVNLHVQHWSAVLGLETQREDSRVAYTLNALRQHVRLRQRNRPKPKLGPAHDFNSESRQALNTHQSVNGEKMS
jgi:hypothetical protein